MPTERAAKIERILPNPDGRGIPWDTVSREVTPDGLRDLARLVYVSILAKPDDAIVFKLDPRRHSLLERQSGLSLSSQDPTIAMSLRGARQRVTAEAYLRWTAHYLGSEPDLVCKWTDAASRELAAEYLPIARAAVDRATGLPREWVSERRVLVRRLERVRKKGITASLYDHEDLISEAKGRLELARRSYWPTLAPQVLA